MGGYSFPFRAPAVENIPFSPLWGFLQGQLRCKTGTQTTPHLASPLLPGLRKGGRKSLFASCHRTPAFRKIMNMRRQVLTRVRGSPTHYLPPPSFVPSSHIRPPCFHPSPLSLNLLSSPPLSSTLHSPPLFFFSSPINEGEGHPRRAAFAFF